MDSVNSFILVADVYESWMQAHFWRWWFCGSNNPPNG